MAASAASISASVGFVLGCGGVKMDRLTAQGYTMVTVPELIRVKGGGLQAGRFYYSGDHFKDKA